MKVEPPAHPSGALHYGHDAYLDAADLQRELLRVGDICHQCRRCLPLCPSFPKLFDLIDAADGEIAGVSEAGLVDVNEHCFHCKQCFNHCPYTPPHEWDVDFPALMRRQQLIRTAEKRTPLTRQLTTRTDLIGRIGSLVPALMNLANRNRLSRVLMEKTLGIHRDWIQPRYQRDTVARWYRRSQRAGSGDNGHVVLFTTCSVNYSDAEVGRAAVRVLEHSDVRVELGYERCCGMPFTDVGDLKRTRRNAEANVAALLPAVEAGASIVVPGPSCSLMLKQEYPKLLDSDAARRVAAATRDLMEYLVELARAKKLKRDFASDLGRVAYHAPCHLRHQSVGLPARALLNLCASEVEVMDACSGVDGTWGMQARFHDASLQVADKLLTGIRGASPDHVATDCPLSALRIEEGLGLRPVHPVVLLARAYGWDA